MPIQAPQWTEFLSCPVCQHEFAVNIRPPISLGCGHTICRTCLATLHRRQCPLDQATITTELDNLPINYALLQLVNNSSPTQLSNETEVPSLSVQSLATDDLQCYNTAKKCIEELALYLKPFSNGSAGNLLSRPMQRKLVTLINCQLIEDEGRSRALRAARSLGERTVTELILQHQNPQQLSANLWAAVRQRGCQFLGPAMQEEVLKLVLLALEDGSPLSRKVLVMFVVQRLEPQFPQASKTSIGHVVQLLYRASCFKVSKREGDSSLMQLKEEFRTYEALRREHDAQIVQIATEAGLRIAPDQWSALLYGDTAHKSHMQSIIDKLQTPQSFNQSVQELVIALQRTNDPAQLSGLRTQLKYLANIDSTTENNVPSWREVAEALTAVRQVVIGLVEFVQHHGNRKLQESGHSSHNTKYKISMCRDLNTRGTCPRGSNCTFAHSEEELEKYRAKSRKITARTPNPNMKDLEYMDTMILGNNNFIPSEETSPMRYPSKPPIVSPKLIQQSFGDKLSIPTPVPNLNSIPPRGQFDHYNNINFQPPIPIPPPLPPVQTISTAIALPSSQTSPMSQNQRGNSFRPIMNSSQNYQSNFPNNNMAPPNNASPSPVFAGNPKNYSPELYANSVPPHNMMSGNALSSQQSSMYQNSGKMNSRMDMMRQNMLWEQQQQQQHHLHQQLTTQPPPNQSLQQHNMHLKPSPTNPMYLSPTSSGNNNNSNRSPPGRNPNMNMNMHDPNRLEYIKGLEKYNSKIMQIPPPTASTSAVSIYGNGGANYNQNNKVLLKDDIMIGAAGPSYWANAQPQNQHPNTAFKLDSVTAASLSRDFVRSDSILNEDDYVEFEAQPTSNKFGPISRVNKCSDPSHPCIGGGGDTDDNLLNNNYAYWYLHQNSSATGAAGNPNIVSQSQVNQMTPSQMVAATTAAHASKVLNNSSCDNFLPSTMVGGSDQFSTYQKIDNLSSGGSGGGMTNKNSSSANSKVQEDVSRLQQKFSELKKLALLKNDKRDSELDKDTDIKMQSINNLISLQNHNDDNCEVGLVKQMHALELRIESEVLE